MMVPYANAASVTFAGKNFLTPAESAALSQAFANHYQVPNFQLHAQGTVIVNAILTRYAQEKNSSATIVRQFANEVDQTMSMSAFTEKAEENGQAILYAEQRETTVAGGKKTLTTDLEYGLKDEAYENQGKDWKRLAGKTHLDFMPSGDFDGFPLTASNLTELRVTAHGNGYAYTSTFTKSQVATIVAQPFLEQATPVPQTNCRSSFLKKGQVRFVVSKVNGSFQIADEKVSILVNIPASKFIEQISGKTLPASVTRGFGNLTFSVAFEETATFVSKPIPAPRDSPEDLPPSLAASTAQTEAITRPLLLEDSPQAPALGVLFVLW